MKRVDPFNFIAVWMSMVHLGHMVIHDRWVRAVRPIKTQQNEKTLNFILTVPYVKFNYAQPQYAQL